MNIKAYFAEKLSAVFFINIKKQVLSSIFNCELDSELYLPLISTEMIKKMREGENFSDISILQFIEGMFYVIGADGGFKFNKQYIKIISKNKNYINFIKRDIFDNVKNEDYDTAYILLKGLNVIESNKENYKKLLDLADYLRSKHSFFKEEEIEVINAGKESFKVPEAYYYECILKNKDGDYDGALLALRNYIADGGTKTKEVEELMVSLQTVSDFEKGKELAFDEPEQSLKLLLPLLKEFNDNTELYYYIAVAYRQLHNYEKAIYYLNEITSKNSGYVDVFNEIGINYTCLGEYNTAIKYLKKAFEASRSVEICTNIVMCYMNMGNLEQAKANLAIAEKLDPKDEVVGKLKEKLQV